MHLECSSICQMVLLLIKCGTCSCTIKAKSDSDLCQPVNIVRTSWLTGFRSCWSFKKKKKKILCLYQNSCYMLKHTKNRYQFLDLCKTQILWCWCARWPLQANLHGGHIPGSRSRNLFTCAFALCVQSVLLQVSLLNAATAKIVSAAPHVGQGLRQ